MADARNLGPAGAASFAQEAYSPGRWALLGALELGPLRYTDLARAVDLSEGEVTRNLRRLADAGLVRRDAESRFSLTPLGHAALVHGAGLEVLGRHASVLSGLALDALPQAQLLGIGALGKARLVTAPFDILHSVQELFSGVRTHFLASWIIGEQALTPERLAMQRDLRNRLSAGVDARAVLLGRELPILRGSPVDGYCQFRQTSTMPMDTIVTDGGALFQFTRPGGAADFNHAFVGDHPAFVAWCRQAFDWQWENATPVPSLAAVAGTAVPSR